DSMPPKQIQDVRVTRSQREANHPWSAVSMLGNSGTREEVDHLRRHFLGRKDLQHLGHAVRLDPGQPHIALHRLQIFPAANLLNLLIRSWSAALTACCFKATSDHGDDS